MLVTRINAFDFVGDAILPFVHSHKERLQDLVRTVAQDRPMDQFARELLTGLGNTLHKPAANFFRIARTLSSGERGAPEPPIRVRTQPGESRTKVNPSPESSAASVRWSWWSAAFDAR